MSARSQREYLAEICQCGLARVIHEDDYTPETGMSWGACDLTGCQQFERTEDHEHAFTGRCFVCEKPGTLCATPGCLTCIQCGGPMRFDAQTLARADNAARPARVTRRRIP